MHKNFSKTEKEKIELYVQEALAFNKKHNLFIRANKDEVFEKDILDCVPLVEKIEKESKILDLGSGGGFPGVVLAILRPDCEVHLLEKSQKKCYFLNKIKDTLRLDNIKVLKQTITKNNTLERVPNNNSQGVFINPKHFKPYRKKPQKEWQIPSFKRPH